MTPGNLELVQVVVSWAVLLPGAAVVIVRDERRLRGAQAGRAWPPASRDSALFAIYNISLFVLLVVPLHFLRTRRSAWGLLIGMGWATVLVAADVGAQLLTALVIEGPGALY
ncbi:MAG: hypothetical protein ACRENE_13795 [Polyangiaceae bacterium]